MSKKKREQLGMHPATASAILLKDLLFTIVTQYKHVCYRCGLPLTRDTFSIDHKIAWLDSEDPKKLFFDIENIAFSHRSCNAKAGRGRTKYKTKEEALEANRERSRAWKRANRNKLSIHPAC